MRLNSDPPFYFSAHVFCCCNERPATDPRGCCASKGAVGLRDYMKKRARQLGIQGVRVNQAGCLDRCEYGPTVVIYPEGVWYSCASTGDVDEILETHLVGGKRVERLMLPPRENSTAEGNSVDEKSAGGVSAEGK